LQEAKDNLLESELRGPTLRVYWHILSTKKKEGIGVRSVQRALGMSSPSRGTCAAGWAWDVSGAVSRLRLSVTMPPIVLPHIVISSRQPHADLVLSIEAERQVSGAVGSRSDAGA